MGRSDKGVRFKDSGNGDGSLKTVFALLKVHLKSLQKVFGMLFLLYFPSHQFIKCCAPFIYIFCSFTCVLFQMRVLSYTLCAFSNT